MRLACDHRRRGRKADEQGGLRQSVSRVVQCGWPQGGSAHGLRKAAATVDALAGWSDAELDAKFGWTGRKMASRYTRAASRERLSLAAAERTKARTESPTPSERVRAEPSKSSVISIGESKRWSTGRTRTAGNTSLKIRDLFVCHVTMLCGLLCAFKFLVRAPAILKVDAFLGLNEAAIAAEAEASG